MALICPLGCEKPLTKTFPSAIATSIPVTEPMLDTAMNSHGPATLAVVCDGMELLWPPQLTNTAPIAMNAMNLKILSIVDPGHRRRLPSVHQQSLRAHLNLREIGLRCKQKLWHPAATLMLMAY